MIPKRRIFDLIAKRRQASTWSSVPNFEDSLSLVHNSYSLPMSTSFQPCSSLFKSLGGKLNSMMKHLCTVIGALPVANIGIDQGGVRPLTNECAIRRSPGLHANKRKVLGSGIRRETVATMEERNRSNASRNHCGAGPGWEQPSSKLHK
jgi:hypothetical protein